MSDKPKTCEWKWSQALRRRVTTCGRGQTTSAHPCLNSYKFCPFCGGEIVEAKDKEKELTYER